MTPLPSFTVAVMAGGRSSRMGTDKSFVRLGDQSLIERVIASAADLPYRAATLVIANQLAAYTHLGLPVFPDVLPGKGALGGIYTALYHSQTPYTLVIACDLPLVRPALLRYLLEVSEEEGGSSDVIIPRVAGVFQGLLALYSRRCTPVIRADLESDRLKVVGFYDRVRVRVLDEADYAPYDPDGRSFLNVNTPEDLAEAARLLAQD